jgi:shikimate kinase
MPDDTIERIVLVGLSGSGKTSVARALAPRLGWEMADSDDWIVAHTGRTIPDVFKHDGEAAFRRIEQAALRALCARPRLVLATGGGVVTVEANWPVLRARSRVVWLRASPERLVARLQAEAGAAVGAARPLLQGDLLARLRALAETRTPLYAQADLTVDADTGTPEEIAASVLAAVLASGAPPVAGVIRERGNR